MKKKKAPRPLAADTEKTLPPSTPKKEGTGTKKFKKARYWQLQWGRDPQTLGMDTRIFVTVFAVIAFLIAAATALVSFLMLAWLPGSLYLFLLIPVAFIGVGASRKQGLLVFIGVLGVAFISSILIFVCISALVLIATESRITIIFGNVEAALYLETDSDLVAFICCDMCFLICIFCLLALVSFGFSEKLRSNKIEGS